MSEETARRTWSVKRKPPRVGSGEAATAAAESEKTEVVATIAARQRKKNGMLASKSTSLFAKELM